MPVVPFSAPAGGSKPKQREVSAADEPWVLMAAAQMDAQGRLLEMEDELPKIMNEPMSRIGVMNDRIERIEVDSAGEDEDEGEWGEPDLPTHRENTDLPTRKSR